MSKLLMGVALVIFTTLSPAFAAFDPNRIVTAVDYVAKTFSCHAKPGEPSYTYKTTSKTQNSHQWKKSSIVLSLGQRKLF